MTEVLVLVEHANGAIRQSALELITIARGLGNPAAIWVGELSDDGLAKLAEVGMTALYHVVGSDDSELTDYLCGPMAEALVAVVAASSEEHGTPTAVLAASTFENKEIVARAAGLLESGVIVDACGVRVDGDSILIDQDVFAGMYKVTSSITKGIAVVAVKPNSIEVTPAAQPVQPVVKEIQVALTPLAKSTKVVTREFAAASDRPDLAEAQIVVAGGRGVQGDFASLTELADELGAAIGSTRVAVDEGWIEHTTQIGQTGVTVAPRLYIGAGISGAIHHRSGMQAAGTIVAINADPEAPIFEFADYGIVGDLGNVVPQLTAELKRLRS